MNVPVASSQKFQRLFRDHPASVGETYLEHLAKASGFGVRLIATGLACLLHALVPAAFTTAASNSIRSLYRSMVIDRQARGPGQ